MGRAKAVTFGSLNFSKKSDALAFLRSLLYQYRPGEKIAEEHAEALAAALQYHPRAKEKIGTGISHFHVRSAEYGNAVFLGYAH